MINGNALYPPSPSPLRLLPARNRSLVGAPTARRGRTTWTAARMSAISWICQLAVAKTVRWPSRKVTGLPWSLRRHSAPNIYGLRLPRPRPHLRADDPVLAPPQRPNDASSSRPDHGRSFVCKGTELLCPDQLRCSAAGGLGRVSGARAVATPSPTIAPTSERAATRVSATCWRGNRQPLRPEPGSHVNKRPSE